MGCFSVLALTLAMGCSHGAHKCAECDKAEAAQKAEAKKEECDVCKKSEDQSAAAKKKADCGCGHKHGG